MSRRRPRAARAVISSETSSDFLRSRLRFVGLGLVCAKFALIPVVFDHASDVPFSVIKALLSHALAYILAGVLVGLFVRYGRAVFVWSWLHVPVLGFFVANVAATLFAVDLFLALYGAHTRMLGLGTIADCVLLYFAMALLVRTRRDALALAVSFLAGSAVVLAYEFVQVVGLDPLTWAIDPATRPFSTVGQTTNLAEYLTVVALGAAAVAIFQGGLPRPARLLLIAYSGLAVVGTVLTQTRSAVLGLIAGGALLVALTWTAHPDRRARVASVVGMVGAAAALALVLFATPLGARILTTVEAPVATEGESGLRLEGAADSRVALYRIALEMLRDRPVFGHGPDNFLAALPSFRSDSEPAEVQDDPTSSAHSWVAQVAVTSGAVGLTAFIAITATALFLTFRRGFRPEAWAALGMLGAFLGAGLTTVNAIATDWLFWAAAGAIAATTSQTSLARTDPIAGASALESRPRRAASVKATTMPRSLIAYVSIGVGVIVALTTFSAVDASRAARASQLARLSGQQQMAIDSGLRATRADALRPQYWDTLGLAYISGNRLDDAVAAFERASALAPYDVRYGGDLARAYVARVLRGDQSSAFRARDVADDVVRTDPNNPLAHQTRAIVMLATGSPLEARRSSERALALDRTSTHPDIFVTGVQVLNALALWPEAITLARRGMVRLPDATTVPIRIELVRALVSNGQLLEALAEIDAALAIRPNDSTAQQLRAQIRAALGN